MPLKPRITDTSIVKRHSSTPEVLKRINIRPRLDYYRNSIYEYDIIAAGFSILRHSGFLSEKEIKFLEHENKKNRNVYIGNLMKENKDAIKYVETGLLKALNSFLSVNNVSQTEVLTVKRDSVFILKKANVLQEKNGITFKLANKYSGFFGFENNIEIYYSFNLAGSIDKLDVKGLDEKKVDSHKCGILRLVKYLLEEIQGKDDPSKLLDVFNNIKKNYLNLSYSVEHYQELNRKSCYRLKDIMLEKNFLIKNISEENKNDLDVMYNYKHVILPIMASALN